MREIKFRGKTTKGKWMYGDFIHQDKFNYAMIKQDNYTACVDEDTVGQYTDLKDKKGAEIYEGDIVKDYFYEKTAEIVYFEGAFWLKYESEFMFLGSRHGKYQPLFDYDNKYVIEVIGNIYDNPELLKESD